MRTGRSSTAEVATDPRAAWRANLAGFLALSTWSTSSLWAMTALSSPGLIWRCYHYVLTSLERARSNPIGKPLPLSELRASCFGGLPIDGPLGPTSATCAAGPSARSALLSLRREVVPTRPRGAGPVTSAALCLDNLRMGDHGAVEFVHEGHGALLREASLLGPREVRGGLPLPRGRLWHLRCIDDLKVVAAVPRSVALVAEGEPEGEFK